MGVRSGRTDCLGQIVAQLAATTGVAQAAQCLALDLADALSGEAEFLPDFLQGIAATILQAKTQAQDACFAWGEGAKHLLDLFAEQILVCALGRRGRVLVLDKGPQLAYGNREKLHEVD